MTMTDGPLTPAMVEEEIDRVLARLEALTEEYARACDAASSAEADYRIDYFKRLLTIKADGLTMPDGTKRKVTDKEAEAHAHLGGQDPGANYRAYKITAGTQEHLKQALYTQRARLDALRTIAANARANAN